MNKFRSNYILIFFLILILLSYIIYLFLSVNDSNDNLSVNDSKDNLSVNNINNNFSMEKFYNYKTLPLEQLAKLDLISEENLLNGIQEMKKHKVIFTAIARDDAIDLPMAMRHIEFMGKFFIDYAVIVFENDSVDATKLILNLWAMINPKVKIFSHDYYNVKRPTIQFLADARNEYLKIMEKSEYDDYDIVIPIDIDLKYGIDIRGVQDSFSKIKRWDMVCSNGIFNEKGEMYDAFAFRDNEIIDPVVTDLSRPAYWSNDMLAKIQIVYPPDRDLVPVNSCFGSMAIYKRELFNGCNYEAVNEMCEHVELHKCMKQKHNARIFLNPVQIIRYANYE